jgi:hypothetical protein
MVCMVYVYKVHFVCRGSNLSCVLANGLSYKGVFHVFYELGRLPYYTKCWPFSSDHIERHMQSSGDYHTMPAADAPTQLPCVNHGLINRFDHIDIPSTQHI